MKWFALLSGLLAFPVAAQDLPCSHVAFFAPTCSSVTAVLPPSPLPLPLPPPPYVNRETQDPPRPLFTPETMAPDVPPLLVKLLDEPTLDNAQQFLDWQAARTQRILEVQQLLQYLAARSRLDKEP